MAVGDYVTDVFPSNTIVNFQPAAGVVICLTHVGCYTQWSRLTDGVNVGRVSRIDSSTIATNTQNTQSRLFIDNNHYLNIPADPTEGSQYTGIQVA